METKFTKGEWFVYNEPHILAGDESMGIDCHTGNGQKSIVILQDEVHNDKTEELANAKLIAAAPDLFKCVGMVELAYRLLEGMLDEPMQSIIIDCKKALKKATE